MAVENQVAQCPVAHGASSSSPKTVFRVGHTGGLRSSLNALRDPFGSLERVSEAGDLVFASILGSPTVIVTHPTLVSEVLRDTQGVWKKDRLSLRAADVFGDGLLLSEGDTWKRQRKLLNPGFSPRRIDGYVPIMRERTEMAVARWPTSGNIDAASEMSRLTLDVAVRTLFGARISDTLAQRVSDAFAAVSDFYASFWALLPFEVPRWLPLPIFRRHARAVAELDAVVGELIAERRQTGTEGEDMLAMLLSARDDEGGLSDKEVRDQAVTFLLAGHETTALGLTFALFELGKSPQLRERLFQEVNGVDKESDADAYPFVTQVFQESLRLYPPAFGLSRENTVDVTFGGVTVKKGTFFLTAPWTLHRDARWHPKPLEFRPERWTEEYEKSLPIGAYLPFGLGPRKCIGTRFAMLEGVHLLAGIARHFDFESVDAALPPLQPAITCRPTKAVRLSVRKRH